MTKTQSKKLKNRHFIICCAIVVFVAAAFICNAFMLGHNYNGPVSKMEAAKALKMYIPMSYKDTMWVKVAKGDSLWVLGMQGNQGKSRYALWVQDNKGNRGFVPVEELDYELKAENPRTKKLESVTVLGFEHGFSRYYCKFADGSTQKIDRAEMYPQMPESLKAHCINIERPKVTMSGDKFRHMVIGKTLNEIEQQTYPAKLVVCHRDSTIAYFRYTDVIDFKKSKSHTNPVVRFDSDGVATSCSFNVANSKTDKYIIRYLPFVKQVIDAAIVCDAIRTPFYTSSVFMTDAPPTMSHRAVIIVFYLFGLLWIWLSPLMPVAVIGAFMHEPAVFKPIDNRTLRMIMILFTVIFCYVWFIALQMWGHFLLFLLINVFIAYVSYKYIASPLDNYIPHDRCLKCRNLFSMEFVEETFDREYNEWSTDSKFAKTLSTKRYKYKTWTHVTTYYSNGEKWSHDTNFQTHNATTTTDLYNDYKVLYKVTVYKLTFKCKKCGKLEYDYRRSLQEIYREHVGQHINTTNTSN